MALFTMSNNATKSIEALHSAQNLVDVFDGLFARSENTRLVRGNDEPIYIPAGYIPTGAEQSFNQVVFAHGFFASALHEIAHWCIAGARRRELLDYGYWYAPDGRNQQQQAEFESVEVKPQAIEWIFCKACEKSFTISVDNLAGDEHDSWPFKQAVYQQVVQYIDARLPLRAQLFLDKLSEFYGTKKPLLSTDFSIEEIA